MSLELRLFSNTLARRIFVLFFLCAMLPFAVISVLAYRHVTGQLIDQSAERLRQAAKSHSLSIYERLLSLEADLGMLATMVTAELSLGEVAEQGGFGTRVYDRFATVTLHRFDRPPEFILDAQGGSSFPSMVKMTDEARNHLSAHGTFLSSIWESEYPTGFALVQSLDNSSARGDMVVAVIQPDFLWGVEQGSVLTAEVSALVLDENSEILFSTLPRSAIHAPRIAEHLTDPHSDQFTIMLDEKEYVASYWRLFLKPRFRAESWTVILTEPTSRVLAPVAGFRTMFPFAVMATFLVVVLLSIRAIKHRMAPLEPLKTAVSNIAQDRFDWHVDVRSGDEFEELANTFNRMARRLDRQFNALETRGAIDRAILSSLDAHTISRTLVSKVPDLLDCQSVMLALMDLEKPSHAKLVTHDATSSRRRIQEREISFTSSEIDDLKSHPEYVRLGTNEAPIPIDLQEESNRWRELIAYPVFLGERLAAVMAVGSPAASSFSPSELAAARALADQLGVALSNSEMVHELRRRNLETIEAFARAVDAKSSWTAGHSERVTVLALEIGRELGLDSAELDCLHRGALLHDVGKLGVAIRILDKPSELDSNEWADIREHPSIGVRILEPISAFWDILPIVGQHHERIDGSGYPNGLTGSNIDLKARILAVADVFDAMISSRPYRLGLPEPEVVERIQHLSGVIFDEDVVQAFLRVLQRQSSEDPEIDHLSIRSVTIQSDKGGSG